MGKVSGLIFLIGKSWTPGELKTLIDEDGIRGVTSNPFFFEKAITSSSDYDEDISTLSGKENVNEKIFFILAVKDITLTAFNDHGKAGNNLESDMDKATAVLAQLNAGELILILLPKSWKMKA